MSHHETLAQEAFNFDNISKEGFIILIKISKWQAACKGRQIAALTVVSVHSLHTYYHVISGRHLHGHTFVFSLACIKHICIFVKINFQFECTTFATSTISDYDLHKYTRSQKQDGNWS